MNTATKIVIDPSMLAVAPTDMSLWFANFKKVTAIEGLQYLNTSETTDMSMLFSNCLALQSIDLSNLSTSNVTYMHSMFNSCSALRTINLNSLDMGNVTRVDGMFYNCTALEKIECDADWNQLNITNSSLLFGNCTSLKGGKGTLYDENYKKIDYARPDGGSEAPGYFWSAGDTGEEPEEIDTREVITTVALQGLDKSIFVVGASMDDIIDAISLSPVDEDAPYYMSGISLMKFDETTSQYGYEGVGETLEEGTYRLSIVVTIDGDEAEWYRFPDSDEDLPTVTLDGQTCFDRFSYVSSSENESRVEFESPNIHVTAQGIEDISVNNVPSKKIVCDGILLILRNGKLYNAQGIEMR